MSDDKVVTFGQTPSPENEADYRARIAAARGGNKTNALKGNDPVGQAAKVPIPDLAALRAQAKADKEVPEWPEGTPTSVTPRPPGSPVIRPETQAKLARAMKAGEAMEKAAAEKQAEETKKESEKEEVEQFMEMLDFGRQNEADRILNNRQRRKAIEDRCEEMDLGDLIMGGEIRQKVSIVPGKLEVVFRTTKPEEDFFIRQLMGKEALDREHSEAYLQTKYAFCYLVCGTVSINDRELPTHANERGQVDKNLFDLKMKTLMQMSSYLIQDLSVNYTWFDLRVRKLFNPEALKNG